VCDKGFYHNADKNECIDCSEGGKLRALLTSSGAIVLMVLIVSVGAGCLYRRCHRKRGEENTEDFEVVRLEQKMQARWESAETKLKALAAFLQIVLNISFTCTVKFPVEFQAVLTTLSLFNLDILPALGIQCWFNAYDCKTGQLITI